MEIAHSSKRLGFELKVESLLEDLIDLDVNSTSEMACIKESVDDIAVPIYNGRKALENSITKVGTHSIRASACNGKYCTFSGAAYAPDNRLVLVDSKNGLSCLLDDTYQYLSSCIFTTYNTKDDDASKKPYRAAYLKNGFMAVSVPEKKKIFSVKIDRKLAIQSELDTLHKAKALVGLKSGDLAVSWTEPVAFGLVSLQYCSVVEYSYFESDKAGRVLKSFNYMAVDEKRSSVIQPCTVDKAVYCFDFQGNPKFEYRHDDLKMPSGVGIDCNGNIYVCDLSNGCIHIISSSGLSIRLHRDGVPEKPLALAFNNDRNTFAVTYGNAPFADRKRNEVHIFQLS